VNAAIDGSWRYAKSLYKANPRVVSRCTRVAVKPTAPSIFGEIKREPSTTAVSTMEAVAMALGELLHDDSAYYLKVRRGIDPGDAEDASDPSALLPARLLWLPPRT